MTVIKQLRADENFGHYLLLKKLGEGGSGEVWLARHNHLIHKPPVAIKFVLRPQEQELARFEREVAILDMLRANPHIIKAEDYGEEHGVPFLVMEYASGGSLTARLGSKLSLETIGSYVVQAANGLDFAHQNGIIHRDLKPSNILFNSSDTLVLADFGIAHQDSFDLTESGAGLGTPEYMSPEQFTDAKHVGVAADVYSFAVIAFQMLTGYLPFGSRKEGKSIYELITAHVNQPIPNITEFNAELPADLQNVFNKALAKKPTERYQSVGEFVNAFHSLISTDQPTETLLLAEKIAPKPALTKTLSPVTLVPDMQTASPLTDAPTALQTAAQSTSPIFTANTKKPKKGLIVALGAGLVSLVVLLSVILLLNLGSSPKSSSASNSTPFSFANASLTVNNVSLNATVSATSNIASLGFPVLDYPNWQKVNISQTLVQQAIARNNFPNFVFIRGDVYSINTNELANVNSALKSQLEDKAQWQDVTKLLVTLTGNTDTVSQLQAVGGFLSAFQKNNLIIILFGTPGTMTKSILDNAPEIDTTKYNISIAYGSYGGASTTTSTNITPTNISAG